MRDESVSERIERHATHQRMLEDHKETKALARERHRKGWHKRKVIPIQMI